MQPRTQLDGIIGTLRDLRRHEHLPTSSMSHQVRGIKVFERIFSDTPLHEAVGRVLSTDQPRQLRPGSIGEFMYGCLHSQVQESDIDPICTPSCLRAFRPDTRSRCEATVYELYDGRLQRLTTSRQLAKYLEREVQTSNSDPPGEVVVTAPYPGLDMGRVYLFTDREDPNYWRPIALTGGLRRFDLYTHEGNSPGYRHLGYYDLSPELPVQLPTTSLPAEVVVQVPESYYYLHWVWWGVALVIVVLAVVAVHTWRSRSTTSTIN